jgi:glycosidase
MKRIFLSLSFLLPLVGFSQKQPQPYFDRIEPMNWWVGMKNSELQVLFYKHDVNIGEYEASINYPGVSIKEKIKAENPHYLFLKLKIGAEAKAGSITFQFKAGKKTFVQPYELKNKSTAANRAQGFNSSDVVYLIFLDRFANGDLKNDSLSGFYEGVHRNKPYGRHGGDLKGVSDHLNYIKELGVTSIWINPVLENNQKSSSYHGYAITDLYHVDKRFGGNEEYMALIEKCHQNGIKVIQDMVMNHIGSEHWLMNDMPEKDWIHQFPDQSNFRNGVIPDPYKSKTDSVKMLNGWFAKTMPDVNQSNPLFAEYLIQNSLWWIEAGGIDGIRMDTYPYNDKYFMARWAKALTDEYPKFSMVGEAWMHNIPPTAYWQKDAKNKDGYNSYLPSVTDFPLCFAVPQALNEKGGWETGIARLYDVLSQDFQYPNANANLTFLDNHDLTRFLKSVGNDQAKFRMGLSFLFTTRGIPEIYYGTEAMMNGDKAVNDPEIRKDFPGGWAGDQVDYFNGKNLSADQLATLQYMKKIMNWRKSKPVVHKGKLTHYIPQDNIYVYFRTLGTETVMVIMNGNNKEMKLNTSRFAESMMGKSKGKNVLTDEAISNLNEITLPAMTTVILELE